MTEETLAKALYEASKEQPCGDDWTWPFVYSDYGSKTNFKTLAARALAIIEQWEAEKQPRS